MEINDVIEEIESVLVPPRLPTIEEIEHKEREREKENRYREILDRL
jgi:hypothetical protein